MTVDELCKKMDLAVESGSVGMDRIVEGAYVSDLLSWVMSHAKKNNVWVTVQAHSNIVAVASLIDLSCIIVAEGVSVDEDTLKKAEENEVPLLTTEDNAYSICCKLNQLGI